MKVKSTKKSLKNKPKKGEKQQEDVVKVKTESELEEEEEGFNEVYINGDGLNIQIKEEPHSQEISVEHNGDPSSCSDTKADTETSRPDFHHQHQQGHIKEECDSDHLPEYDFTEAAVKEESESWIKEEKDSEEEAEEREGVCRGRGHSFATNNTFLRSSVLFVVSVFLLLTV